VEADRQKFDQADSGGDEVDNTTAIMSQRQWLEEVMSRFPQDAWLADKLTTEDGAHVIDSSDGFAAEEMSTCMSRLRLMATEYPKQVRDVVQEGSHARKPHTYLKYILNLERAYHRIISAD